MPFRSFPPDRVPARAPPGPAPIAVRVPSVPLPPACQVFLPPLPSRSPYLTFPSPSVPRSDAPFRFSWREGGSFRHHGAQTCGTPEIRKGAV
ncbi:hypothetical protein GCM10017752_58810 [Streptomyces roseoviridis]